MCRPCRKAYNAEYYQRNKDRHNPGRINRRKQMASQASQYMIDYLRQHPCTDCGEADVVVLEFDHLRDKKYNISDLIRRGYPIETLQAEIEKCEVVCANDHRRRTARRGNWRRSEADNAPLAQR